MGFVISHDRALERLRLAEAGLWHPRGGAAGHQHVEGETDVQFRHGQLTFGSGPNAYFGFHELAGRGTASICSIRRLPERPSIRREDLFRSEVETARPAQSEHGVPIRFLRKAEFAGIGQPAQRQGHGTGGLSLVARVQPLTSSRGQTRQDRTVTPALDIRRRKAVRVLGLRFSGCDRRHAQRPNRLRIVGLAEDRRAGDQDVGAGRDRRGCGLGVDASVDLDADRSAGAQRAGAGSSPASQG
jgi:hypothetical protein